MVNLSGPGASAPFSKSPTNISGFQLPRPLFRSSSELATMSKKSNDSLDGAHDDEEDLIDFDDPMDGSDAAADPFDSDFENMEDPPDYISLEQESEVNPKPKSSYSIRGDSKSPKLDTVKPSSQSLPDECVMCDRPKRSKDSPTCGSDICDRKLKNLQGHGSSRPTGGGGGGGGPPANNRCPVCQNFKPSGDIICGSGYCVERLRFWQEGTPTDPRLSNGRPGSYSGAVQTRSQSYSGGMCEVCHQRPRYSHNGKTFPTCGLTCASKFNPSSRVEMCDFCRQRPKVVLNGRIYPHCGRTCRDKAKALSDKNGQSVGSGTGSCTTCLNCWKAPGETFKDEFCSDSCREIIERRAPLLLEVPRGHASFNEVEHEFKNSWNLRKAPCPSIKKIYMLCIPAKQEANYKDYSKKVTSSYVPGAFSSRKKEEFRWIPGFRDCALGHPGIVTPCVSPQCALCNVLRGTYLAENFERGISTMSLPRATQTYDHWASKSVGIKTSKIVLLSRVSPGKVVELERFRVTSVPPQNANSVKIVNYSNYSRVDTDELVVYSCEALRPVYLIAYE